MSDEKHTARLDAAREAADLFHGGSKLEDGAHRRTWISDRVTSYVQNACKKNGRDRAPFTQEQVECLLDLAVYLAITLDTHSWARQPLYKRVWVGFRRSNLADKLTIIAFFFAAVSAVATFAWSYGPSAIDWIFKAEEPRRLLSPMLQPPTLPDDLAVPPKFSE